MKTVIKSPPAELILLLAWILAVLLVNPMGEFPINDDWAYSRNVWFLSEKGRFVFSDWPGMTLISQTLIGALATKVFGFSFGTLRITTLVFGISFILVLYGFLRKLKVHRNDAVFTSLLVMFLPLFLSLSFTFMTEIYFLFFFLTSLYFYSLFLKGDKNIFLVISTLFALISTLTRQTGLIVPLAIGMVEILRSRGNVVRILQSMVPFLVVWSGLWLFSYILESTGNLPENFGKTKDLLETLRTNNPDYFLCKAGTMLMYMGLFTLPLAIRKAPAITIPRTGRKAVITGVVLSFMVVLIIMGYKGFPAPNCFYNFGLGPKILKDSYWGDNLSPVLPPLIWNAVKILAASGAILLAMAFLSKPKTIRETITELKHNVPAAVKMLLSIVVCLYLVYLLINKFFFDRYTIPVSIFTSILLSTCPGEPDRKRLRISNAFLMLFILFSLTAVRDFMEWNRTRWRALKYLMEEEQIDARKIDGGFEFNAWYQTGPINPIDKNEKSWWFVTEDEYVLSCGLIEGFQLYKSYTFYRWLFPGKDSVQILRHPIEGRLPYEFFPITCDCEILDENSLYLLSQTDSIRFEGGFLRSEDHARSGRYSVKLDQHNQYAFLHRFKDVRAGERFRVRIWRYGGDDRVQIVAGASRGCHYVSASGTFSTDNKGWKLLELDTVIPEGFACYRYGIFLWNSGDSEVWLDDLEITRQGGYAPETRDQE